MGSDTAWTLTNSLGTWPGDRSRCQLPWVHHLELSGGKLLDRTTGQRVLPVLAEQDTVPGHDRAGAGQAGSEHRDADLVRLGDTGVVDRRCEGQRRGERPGRHVGHRDVVALLV